VTTATVTVTVAAGGAAPPARATPPPKSQPNNPLKISSVSIPPKQAPPKQAPPKQAPPKQAPPKKAPPKQAPPKQAPAPVKNNKPPKTTDKKVVKTTTAVNTLTFTPGTYTTTSTSASESTFLSTWTTVAPVTVTNLATVTVTETQPVTTTVAGKPIKTKVVKTKTKIEKVTQTKTAVVTQTAVVTSTAVQTVVVTQTFEQPTTVIQTETIKETETVKVTETDTATAVTNTDTAVTDTVVTDTAVTDTVVTNTAVTDTAVTDTAVTDTAVTDTAVTDTAITDTAVTATASDTAAPPAATEDPQVSLTLDPRVIQPGLALDGQQVPVAGQVPSLTSKNNFINFCLTQNVPLTDGKQVRAGSCNVVPMGRIIPKANLPSSKFVFPKNFSTLKANQPFTIQMKVKNMDLGFFTNAQLNYYAAPAQLNDANIIVGHTHVVIEPLTSLDQTEPADPTAFAFFKGVNSPPNGDGVVTADVAKGLAAGTYRLFSINTASNHQPVLASVAQHGSMDDGIYFTVV